MIFQSGTYEPYFTGQIFNVITQKNEQYIPLIGHVQSEFGCIETINLKARILDRIKTSNVFSPNGDNKNDIWGIPYSDLFPDLEIKIFNRWGAVVWSAKGNEASDGWNGKNKNGKDLPVGTYYYVISFNVEGTSKWKPVSGSVTIIR
jgi:gliding motility-associated-like protein